MSCRQITSDKLRCMKSIIPPIFVLKQLNIQKIKRLNTFYNDLTWKNVFRKDCSLLWLLSVYGALKELIQ